MQFGVVARRLLNRLLDRENVRDLGTDVEMDQLEAVGEPSDFKRSQAARISTALKPNLAFSPPLSAHFPAPLASRRTRMPTWGSTPSCLEIPMIWRNSSSFSTTRMTCLPSLMPSRAIRMKVVSL
jgi:hypothetical protein